MRVRWTTDAADDVEQICDNIAIVLESPTALLTTSQKRWVDSFPNRGRLGRVEGTRELVLAPLPFIAVYARDQLHLQLQLSGSRVGRHPRT